MKRVFGLIMMMGLVCSARAQFNLVDSIQKAMEHQPRFVLGLNNRYSLVAGEPVRVNGIQAGMDYQKEFKILFGINWMPVSQTESFVHSSTSGMDTITKRRSLQYFSIGAEYAVYRSPRWKLSVPVLLGLGTYRVRTSSALGKWNEDESFMLPIEFGANATYYFTDWLGLKAGLGNRLGFGRGFSATSGPYYALGFTLFIGPLVDKIRTDLGS